MTAKVQGVPGAATTCWWLIDQQDFFQLELFQFHRPRARPLPADWTPADIGYSTIGIHVSDFDATLARAARHGAMPRSAPLGLRGVVASAVRDPDGVLIEILRGRSRAAEPRSRPRPELPSVVRFVRASVPDLEQSRRFFVDGLGLGEAGGIVLHTPEHEALWGLAGAARDTLLLWANDLLIELVHYTEPAGRPWPPNYYIGDQGLLNIAFGFRTRRALDQALAAAKSAGAKPNWRVLELGAWGVVYVNDVQGFSVELLYVRPWWTATWDSCPARPTARSGRACTSRPPRRRSGRGWSTMRACPSGGRAAPAPAARGGRCNGPGAVREISDRLQTLTRRSWRGSPDGGSITGCAAERRCATTSGRVRLEPLADGTTELHYEIRFTAAIAGTGWLLQRVIGGMLGKGLRRLQTLCESNHAKGT